MKTLIISIIVLSTNVLLAQAQADKYDYPIVGKPCPDFTLQNVEYYSKTKVSLKDFRGKWLMLDFWSEYCSSCIKSFSRTNDLQKHFKKELQIIMIGKPREKLETIRRVFNMHTKKHNLNLPIAYSNELAERFKVDALPCIIVIDPNGDVRAITYEIKPEDIISYLKGGDPILPKSYLKVEKKPYANYNANLPLSLKNSNSNYIFRSMFTKWVDSIQPYSKRERKDRLELLGYGLKQIYLHAYFGKERWYQADTALYGKAYLNPILELTDSSLFVANEAKSENLFCYSVSVGDSMMFKKIDFRRVLQNDLEQYLPFDATIETRLMPCYKLYIDEEHLARIKTKEKLSAFEWKRGYRQGFIAKNTPFNFIIGVLESSYDFPRNCPVLNTSGIVDQIDLNIDSAFFDEMIKELREKYGIVVQQEKTPMKVLIIRERKHNPGI